MSPNVYNQLATPGAVAQMLTRARPTAIRTISSLPEAYAFVQVAHAYAAVGNALLEFTLDIHQNTLEDQASRTVYIPTMRKALRAAPNLTDLTLLLPKTTLDAIFFQIYFPALRSFRSNLPHRKIRPFLVQHPALTTLVVGPCGAAGPCPLADIQLDQLTTLECHAPCLHALAHGGLVFLKVENHSATCYMSSILCNLPSPMLSLYSLSVDLFPNDTDVLLGILLAAPRVKKLKFLERPAKLGRRAYRRRAFNDYLSWYRGLRKLALLEELALQTAFPLSSCPGDRESERRVISGWVNGLRYRRSSTAASRRAHPNLYHVMLWYGARTQGSTISKWFKDDEEWQRLGEPTTGAQVGEIDF